MLCVEKEFYMHTKPIKTSQPTLNQINNSASVSPDPVNLRLNAQSRQPHAANAQISLTTAVRQFENFNPHGLGVASSFSSGRSRNEMERAESNGY